MALSCTSYTPGVERDKKNSAEKELTKVEIIDFAILRPDVVLFDLEFLPKTRDLGVGRRQLLALLDCERGPLFGLLVEPGVLKEDGRQTSHQNCSEFKTDSTAHV